MKLDRVRAHSDIHAFITCGDDLWAHGAKIERGYLLKYKFKIFVYYLIKSIFKKLLLYTSSIVLIILTFT